MNPTVAFILKSQQDSMSRHKLSVWTVYGQPDGYVARKFEFKSGKRVWNCCATPLSRPG